MEEEAEVSIDEVRLWTVSALKEFCRRRNLKITRRKDELVATVYAVLTNPSLAPLATSAADAEAEKAREYSDLLKTPTGTIPDPRTLTNWESEEDGVKYWPSTMILQIDEYLKSIDDVDLPKRLMQDYKDQKAYSYLASGWLGEVQYHRITDESQYCALRADCTPSQHIRDIPWKVWVVIEKKSGRIHSAFCTCFAGFSSTCNHVGALLFKVDYAWKTGMNNPACTSKPCEWSAFGGRRAFQPQRISDLVLSKPKFSKQGSSRDSKGINPRARQLFSPLGARSTSNPTSTMTLAQDLYPYFQDAAVFQYINMEAPSGSHEESAIYSDVNVNHEEEVVAKNIPVPLDSLGSNAPSVEAFMDSLPTYSAQEIEDLEEATRGQADNEQWRNQRKGRVTGSVAHAVLTKQRSREATTKELNTTSLVKRILGCTSLDSSLPALRYGCEMEGEARNAYVRVNKANHRHLRVKDCGLFVLPDKVFLGASPDGIIKCSCCEKGVLEIKCPHSIAYTKPSADNLEYVIVNDAGVCTLKKSHAYYSQVQHQMGVTGARWCDFFIYTRHGHLTIRIKFDQERWEDLVNHCTRFFRQCLVREIVHKIEE